VGENRERQNAINKGAVQLIKKFWEGGKKGEGDPHLKSMVKVVRRGGGGENKNLLFGNHPRGGLSKKKGEGEIPSEGLFSVKGHGGGVKRKNVLLCKKGMTVRKRICILSQTRGENSTRLVFT